jgi:thiol-disulfide isomerase/thioredoxin
MPPHLSRGAVIEATAFSVTAALIVAKLCFDHYHAVTTHRSKRRVSFKVPGECSLLPGTSQPILGVLFAAAWCPDCADVVPAIGKLLNAIPEQSVIEIYYVGSESSEYELKKFVPKSIKIIPFGAADQRADLKRHFQTCAKKEMSELGLSDRKHGIPTLLLIETATGRILSEDGVDHVMHGKNPESIFRKWADMLDSKDSNNDNTTTANNNDAVAP